ncbi:unnamed protein product [Symbiodinium pilosum]|uniref:Uncharacterized protein n=1 Tax=Symbiodinium pilosum TaxID=2952 RepID=A0A812KR55_SYMPI|nr:unnamed protein product [Symbiodinium pilosum]
MKFLNTTATSPLPVAVPAPLASTELHVHRVSGDWASWGLRFLDPGPGKVHTHDAKTSVQDPHSLRHFLPDKADSDASAATSSSDDQPTLVDPRDTQVPAVPRRPLNWEALLSLATCVGLYRKGSTAYGRPRAMLQMTEQVTWDTPGVRAPTEEHALLNDQPAQTEQTGLGGS